MHKNDGFCIGYYLSRNVKYMNGYLSHIGIAILDGDDVITYSYKEENNLWETPGIYLEGDGDKIQQAEKMKFIGDVLILGEKEIEIIKKGDYGEKDMPKGSRVGAVDVVVAISYNIRSKLDCNYAQMNIADACKLIDYEIIRRN